MRHKIINYEKPYPTFERNGNKYELLTADCTFPLYISCECKNITENKYEILYTENNYWEEECSTK